MSDRFEPTEAELRSAYRLTRLWMQGITLQRAMADRLLRVCLRGIAINQQRRLAANGTPAPNQPALI